MHKIIGVFLDALASLDFKLSVTESVSEFFKYSNIPVIPVSQVIPVRLAHLWVDFRVICSINNKQFATSKKKLCKCAICI